MDSASVKRVEERKEAILYVVSVGAGGQKIEVPVMMGNRQGHTHRENDVLEAAYATLNAACGSIRTHISQGSQQSGAI